ncbi:TPA: hypothetical protein SMI21_001874 [Serratia marcescens]|nr:hypothetical protein [Serratia marcescens]HEJ7912729.1 hypothetical protein [Serratia marcescens]HEJ8074841.1 hypothetical protein [Serratia marcescens]HEJ9007078.1 hypothetical protein [Serratia marcescens]
MDADLISYESMLAARDSASWAFWGMIASFCSVIATLFTAYVALKTINSWKIQLRAQELKDFSLAAYGLQKAISNGPDIEKGKELNDSEFTEMMLTYDALEGVYRASLLTHDVTLRAQTSRLYNVFADIQKEYTDGEIGRREAVNKILKIRIEDPLLSSSY